MSKIIALLLVAIFVSSCGTMKKHHEEHTTSATETTKNDIAKTVTEKVDTTVTIKRDSVVAVRPIDDLLHGKPIQATDGGSTVRVTYDSISGNVRAVGITEEREVPITIDKTTVETDKTTSVAKSNEAIVQESKERKGANFEWSLILILFIIIAVIALYLIFFRRPRDGLRSY